MKTYKYLSKSKNTIVTSLMIVVILVSVYFGFIYPRIKGAILSIDNIRIEPTGSESGGEWKNSYWVISAITDTTESYLFHEFSKTTIDTLESQGVDVDYMIGNETIMPNATIELTITSGQPYYEMPLTERTFNVYPDVYKSFILPDAYNPMTDSYKGSVMAPSFDVKGYEKALLYWTLHSPFDITVEKIGGFDNNSFSETVTIDTVGGTDTIQIVNPNDLNEKLLISNLGQLGTGYSAPIISDFVVVGGVIYERTQSLIDTIVYDTNDYSFSNYWFGGGDIYVSWGGGTGDNAEVGNENWKGYVQRWYDDGSPMPMMYMPYYGWFNELHLEHLSDGAESVEFSGWILNHWTSSPDEFEMDPQPASIQDLIDYLYSSGYSNYGVDVWNEGYELTENNLKIYMPFSSVSSLVTVKISTELSDSYVYQPIVEPILSNGTITSINWFSNQNASVEISDSDLALLKIKQLAENVTNGRITVTATSDSSSISINPVMKTLFLDSNEEGNVDFIIENLGVASKESVIISFTLKNDFGDVTATGELTAILVPKTDETNETILKAYVYDTQTSVQLTGINVTIEYNNITDSSESLNGEAFFDLDFYTGPVKVTAQKSVSYLSFTRNKTVTAGVNTVLLPLSKPGGDIIVDDDDDFSLLFGALVVIIIAVVTSVVVFKSAKLRKKLK